MWINPLCAQRGGLSLTSKAIDLPAGEKSGAVSAAGVEASGVTFALATSTIETSELVQSFAEGVRTWLKTIRAESGDQSKLLLTL